MFKQGDKAICTLTDGAVKIEHGPYTSTNFGMGSYLVEWLDGVDQGRCSVVGAEDLEPAPKFKLGQEIELAGVAHTVTAGPFNSGGSNWYVLENKDGHTTCTEDHMGKWTV